MLHRFLECAISSARRAPRILHLHARRVNHALRYATCNRERDEARVWRIRTREIRYCACVCVCVRVVSVCRYSFARCAARRLLPHVPCDTHSSSLHAVHLYSRISIVTFFPPFVPRSPRIPDEGLRLVKDTLIRVLKRAPHAHSRCEWFNEFLPPKLRAVAGKGEQKNREIWERRKLWDK